MVNSLGPRASFKKLLMKTSLKVHEKDSPKSNSINAPTSAAGDRKW